jgi:hypothetical protein
VSSRSCCQLPVPLYRCATCHGPPRGSWLRREEAVPSTALLAPPINPLPERSGSTARGGPRGRPDCLAAGCCLDDARLVAGAPSCCLAFALAPSHTWRQNAASKTGAVSSYSAPPLALRCWCSQAPRPSGWYGRCAAPGPWLVFALGALACKLGAALRGKCGPVPPPPPPPGPRHLTWFAPEPGLPLIAASSSHLSYGMASNPTRLHHAPATHFPDEWSRWIRRWCQRP